MAKDKLKKHLPDGSINPKYLEEMKRKTLIESTASSLRMSGINVTDKEVEQIVKQSINEKKFHKNINQILSSKQLAVLEYLTKAKEATPGQIADKTKIARPTVNQALDKLIRLKKVERIGMGRGTRYKIL
jgi:predicted HTH transcriptional regulator